MTVTGSINKSVVFVSWAVNACNSTAVALDTANAESADLKTGSLVLLKMHL